MIIDRIKAVIFDLDGTLGNTIPLCIEAFRKAIEPLTGKILSDDEITSTFGPSEEGTIKALAPENFEKGLSDYLINYELLHDKCPNPYEGIINLLHTLKNKNIRIAMVTGKGLKSTEITLNKFAIAHFFEIIETGKPEGPSKTEGIKTVLNLFSEIDKNEIIYVGDATGDIIASKKAGIPIVAAAWAETAQVDNLALLNPHKLFKTINDFSEWLNSIT